MLEVNNVQFSYQADAPHDSGPFEFNLTAELGEIVVVQGMSGVGKSTLLHLIAGLLTPKAGRITWRGADLTALPPDARPLSMIFQDVNLFDHLSCRQNVAIGINGALRLTPQEWRQVDQALDVLGVLGLAEALPSAISGGQQQRVALARALARAQIGAQIGAQVGAQIGAQAKHQERDLLLMDEPFSALDPETRQDCIDAVRQLMATRPMTAVVVSHDKNDAKALGARCLSLKRHQ